jgi:hypothetical protein
MSVALLLYPGLGLGRGVVGQRTPFNDSLALASFVAGTALLVLVAALWLRSGARGAAEARACRNVAWCCLLLPAVGLGLAVVRGDTGTLGIARIATVAVFAYAILRHQLLGLDVKVRWTIKQSTVAAAFVGVFFVASEGAQAFFAENAGSQWVGIAAAGALVFAIAPLQRAAERVASAAVPLAGEALPAAPSRDERGEVYKAAVRVTLRDRVVTAAEEDMLGKLADHLGLSPSAALRARREVEGELAAQRAAGPPLREVRP